MKKENIGFYGCILFVVLFFAGIVYAAGTNVATLYGGDEDPVRSLKFAWNSNDGTTVPNTSNSIYLNGYICMVTTKPGTTNPTALYDVTIVDGNNLDIMGGELADRSATLPQQVIPKIGNGYGCRHITGALTAVVSNNSVTGASGTIAADYLPDRK